MSGPITSNGLVLEVGTEEDTYHYVLNSHRTVGIESHFS